MKLDIDEELHGRSLGWICPKCGRVHAPFIMECFYCNDKLKSEEIIHYPFVTIDDEYLKYTTSSEFNKEYLTYTNSSQEQLQESLDGLNKELENIGVQPTSLDELKDIKTIIKDIHQNEEISQHESNDDMWPTEQEVKAHLKYIKEQTELEKNIIDDDMSYWKCSRCGKVHLVFPEGGCECDAPLEYLIYVI